MDSYNVTGEIGVEPTSDRVEALIDRLAAYHPAVYRSDYGHMEVVITVPAESLEQAIQTAAALIGSGSMIRLEAMPTATFDERLGVDPMPELVSVTEAASRLGITRQGVIDRIAAGRIPARKVGSTYVIPQSAVSQGA